MINFQLFWDFMCILYLVIAGALITNSIMEKEYRVRTFYYVYLILFFNVDNFISPFPGSVFTVFILVPTFLYYFSRILAWIYVTITKDEEDYRAFISWF